MSSRRSSRLGDRPAKAVNQARDLSFKVSSSGWIHLSPYVFLLCLTLLAYTPVLRAGFVWDDDDHITANPKMTAPRGLAGIWIEQEFYYPLTSTSWWLMRRAWGLTPLPYHLVNVLLHAINAMLLWRLLARLGVPGAWMVGAVFALHPVHAQSVAWATELKNCQSGLFYLLALSAWVRVDNAEGRTRWRWYGASLACFALAVASKTSTVVLAPILPLVDLRLRRRLDGRTALRWLPFWALLTMAAWVTIRGQAAMSTGLEWDHNLVERMLLAGRTFWFYLGKLFYPVNLSFVYAQWTMTPSQAVAWVPLCALIVVLAVTSMKTLAGDRRWLPTLMATLYFLVALAPVLGFFRIYYHRYSWVADHWQYLASMGALAWIVGGATRLAERWIPSRAWRRLGMAGAVTLLGLLGVLTSRQARVYRNDETLWLDVLAKNPRCWLAHNNLGLALLETNRIQAAIASLAQGLRLKPDDTDLHFNIAIALARAGRTDQAVEHYRQVLRIEPDHAEAESNLGKLLAESGRTEEGIERLERALRLRPDSAETENDLGAALADVGRWEEARAHYEAALQIKPQLAEARRNLGIALERGGQLQEALAQYQTALRLKPDYTEAENSLGNLLIDLGRAQEAVSHFERALDIRSDFAEAENGLGRALAATGRAEQALAHFEIALRIRPRYAVAEHNLGSLLAQMGRFQDAVAHYEAALRLQPMSPDTLNGLAFALLQVGRSQAARARFEQALGLSPDNPEIHYNFGVTLASVGRLDEAIAHFREAVRLDPEDDDARMLLAKALRQAGRSQ